MNKGGISCSFATCKNINRGAGNKISFFRFPKNIERYVKDYAKIYHKTCTHSDRNTYNNLYNGFLCLFLIPSYAFFNYTCNFG